MQRRKPLRKNVNDELRRRKEDKSYQNCNFKLINKTKRISLFQYKVLSLYFVEMRKCVFKHEANLHSKKDKNCIINKSLICKVQRCKLEEFYAIITLDKPHPAKTRD